MNLSKTDTGSHGLFGHEPSEILLSELFVDRFGAQAWQMLEAFLAALGRTALPFDLPEQLRRLVIMCFSSPISDIFACLGNAQQNAQLDC